MSATILIDYGAGNLRSVANALHSLDAEVQVVSSGADFPENPARVILPGVGSFGDSMEELTRRGLAEPVRRAIAAGVPFLGICVGYQLLFEGSEESPGIAGLGILQGQVVRFQPGKKSPTWAGTPHTSPIRSTRAGPAWERIRIFISCIRISPRRSIRASSRPRPSMKKPSPPP